MAGMTKDQLNEHILSVVGPTIKAEVGPAVAEAVEAAVSKHADQRFAGLTEKLVDAARGGSKDEPTVKREPGLTGARVVRAIMVAKINQMGPDGPIKILEQWGDADLVKDLKAHREKALSSGDATAGGFLVSPTISSDLIEFLRPRAVVRSLNPMTIQMPTGSVKVPKVTSGSTASYIGENRNIAKSEPAFGQITLSFKKLAALVPISNDLLRHSSPSADTVVRDDLVRAMAAREDLAFISGDGSDATPKGTLNWVHSSHKFAAAGVTLDNITSDLGKAMQRLMDAELELMGARCGWMISPQTWRYLTTIRTTNGPFAFRDEMLQRGNLLGFPFRVTTQVPTSKIYFVGFANAVIGEALTLQVDASQEAAYHDGSAVVASFSQDQTVIRVISEHDFALRYDKSAAVIESGTWGA